MKHEYLTLPLLTLISQIYGCASIVSGQNQVVTVFTPNCSEAKCELEYDDGSYLVTTPGTVSVNREYDPMTVSCEKEGYDPVAISVESFTKDMAYGNILFGGGIGAGVDMATGAAYDYPSEIINPLDCRTKEEIATALKSGNYDYEVLKLVDLNLCDAPVFAMSEGTEEIYKSKCKDGTVGVISCSNSECHLINVSAPA